MANPRHQLPSPDEVRENEYFVVRCIECRLLFVSSDPVNHRVCGFCTDVVDLVGRAASRILSNEVGPLE